jgi:23S rRNA (cytidine2498-2'-O)-methyltransferase
MSAPLAYSLILYCRPGFENECAAEASALCGRRGVAGYARTTAQSGYVHFVLHEGALWNDLAEALPFAQWVFPRQRVFGVGRVDDLPERDRVTPIADAVAELGLRVGRVWGETADTNDAKELSGFIRRFTPHLEKALAKQGSLRPKLNEAPTLHLFFRNATSVDIGLTHPDDASPWPMGIARLRMPRAAPSRSTLKLAEAFQALMTPDEQRSTLRAGLRAADLGAAPGGWTLQFAERGMHVTAVDNGPIADSVLATGMVEHARADGFAWRPQRKLDWMVCDMVEQPSRVAALAADWVATGRCQRSIFNLKLPMKKRWDEIERCRKIIDQRMRLHDDKYVLRMKHLYHDREEITAYLARV